MTRLTGGARGKRILAASFGLAVLLAVLFLAFFMVGKETAQAPLGLQSAAAQPPAQKPPQPADSNNQPAKATTPADDSYVPNQLLVKFQPDIPATEIARVLRVIGGEVIREYASTPGLILIAIPDAVTVEEARSYFERQKEVEYAEPNLIYHTQIQPNDPRFSELWGMHNTGQTGGEPDVDINAPEAWDEITGDHSVVIGIIDTGIDYDHPDLRSNVWTNPGEIANNGIDDDGNGWVDDIHGINAMTGSGDPMDDNGHGTHVFGTIAARGNDGTGVAGVMWEASVIGCKFLNSNGSGDLADALLCLDYFAALDDAGIEVVVTNNSWGGGSYSSSLYNAISGNGDRGILFVAAAGNDGRNLDSSNSYPASYDLDNMISVAAIDHQGNLAYFSNYGAASVDIAAPGVNITSTLPGNVWGSHSGTSMAAPHVTGILGLAKASAPYLDSAALKDHLLNSAVSSPALANRIIDGRQAVIELPFVDADGDGMDDRWERDHGFDPRTPTDAALDADSDGLSNLEEYVAGTRPRDGDSDDDGLTDGSEVNEHGTDPLQADSDGDGLNDYQEIVDHGTDPADGDSDGDGLSDYLEVVDYGTNPLNADSDQDGIPDGWELDYGLDPIDGSNGGGDPDGDGLTNREEFGYGTSPLRSDTDGDGLTDSAETGTHGTDPTAIDSDTDGIPDGWEVEQGLDPLDGADAGLDPDGDGFDNRREYNAGTDPNNPLSVPPNPPWYAEGGNAARNPVANLESDINDFSSRWNREVSGMSPGQYVVAAGGKAYLRLRVNGEDQLQAFSLADGKLQWSQSFVDHYEISSPTFGDGRVYLLDRSYLGDSLVALNSDTGERLYSVSIGSRNANPPLPYEEDVYIADSSLRRIDGATGEVLWETDLGFTTYDPIAITPQHVLVTDGYALEKYDRETGAKQGSRINTSCDSNRLGELTVDGDFAYLASISCLVKLDLNSGSEVWAEAITSNVNQLAVEGGRIYAQIFSTLKIFDAGDGSLLNSLSGVPYGDMVVTLHHILLSDSSRTVALDSTTGEQTWTTDLGGKLGVDQYGGLVIRSDRGQFRVVDLEGDTDGDGMRNWWERYYRLDYLRPEDATEDPDGDGLDNLQEFGVLSNPRSADTDGDGLGDADEVLDHGTSPNNGDTDGDGLSDPQEIDQYHTDPLAPDSDGDGYTDGEEVDRYDTDPNDADSQPPRLEEVFESFESGLPDGWATPADAQGGWSVDDSTASHESHSLRAGEIDDEDLAAAEWVNVFRPGRLSFKYKVVTGYCCDMFHFYVDGNREFSARSTDGEWKEASIYLSGGQHKLRWEFIKDSWSSGESDTVWVDEVRFQKAMFGNREDHVVVVNSQYLEEYDRSGRLIAGPMNIKFENFYHRGDVIFTNDHWIALPTAPYLRLYNPLTGETRSTSVPGWLQRSGYASEAGIVNSGSDLLAADANGGLLRFSQNGEYIERVLESMHHLDVAMGPDGNLYSLVTGTPNNIRVVSPGDWIEQRTIDLPESGVRAFTVNQAGQLLLLAGTDLLIKTDASGTELSRTQLSGLTPMDLDMSADGMLLVGTTNGLVSVRADDLSESLAIEFSPGDHWQPGIIGRVERGGNDSDGDGLPDWWESEYGLNPRDSGDAVLDLDGDGLSNAEEYAAYSHPGLVDTDGDGLSDSDEVESYHSDPTLVDTDGDGLDDYREVTEWRTSPLLVDSDGDGLSDYVELIDLESNPLNGDSDGDGMPDLWEVENGLSLIDSTDGAADEDGDGLNNLEEYQAGTDIRNSDSDFDGLPDRSELLQSGTDPLDRDSDDDRLADGWELDNGLDPLAYQPPDQDTDGDGSTDLQEFLGGSDPGDPNWSAKVDHWAMYQGDSRHSGFKPFHLDENRFTKLWSAQPISYGYTAVQLSADAERAYFMTREGLFAFELTTGEIAWEDSPDNSFIYRSGQPAIGHGQLYVQMDTSAADDLRALDPATGEENFSRDTSLSVNVLSPTVYDNSVYLLGGYYANLYSFDPQLTQQWLADLPRYDKWSPAADREYLYANTGLTFNILDRSTGGIVRSWQDTELDWQTRSMGASPVLGTGDNIFITLGGRLISLDIRDATMNWALPGGFVGQLATSRGSIFVQDSGDLVSVDEYSGAEVWRLSDSSYFNQNIVVTVDHVFVSNGSTTWAVDVTTGEKVWEFNAGGQLSLTSTGVLLISASNGLVTAVRVIDDEDVDGIADSWESARGLDSTDAADAGLDPDQDGLSNAEEYRQGVSPDDADSDSDGLSDGEEVNLVGSDPARADTDGDGLLDGDEVNNRGSDPLNTDSDGDDLDDAQEVELGTDPSNRDTDGDGINDGFEVDRGSDPNDAADLPPSVLNLTIDFEDQQVPAGWLKPGAAGAGWEITNQMSRGGEWALRSSPIGSNQIAGVEWTDVFDEVDIAFDVAARSEYCCDRLTFYVDDEVVIRRSGSSWENVRYSVGMGTHTLRWEYRKEYSVGAMEDATFIDNVVVSPSDTDGDTLPNYWERQYGLPRNRPDGQEDPDGDGFTNVEEFAADTDPTDAASHPARQDSSTGGGASGGGGSSGGGGGAIDPLWLLLLMVLTTTSRACRMSRRA